MSNRQQQNVVLGRNSLPMNFGFNTKRAVNSVLNQFREKLLSYDMQPFGSNMSGCANELTSVTCYSRFVKKFAIPDPSVQDSLTEKCYSDYITYEETHLADFHHAFSCLNQLHPDLKKVLYVARHNLHTWLSKFSYNSKFLDLDYTPGESYISSKGHTSIAQKLGNKEHWTTTWSCLEDTCQLIYRHRALKRMARSFFPSLSGTERYKLHVQYCHMGPVEGYHVFKHLLIEHVLTIVDGARASTVDKDNEKRRFINVEPTFPLLLQRSVAKSFLKCLEANDNKIGDGGFVREGDGQRRHRYLISNPDVATIDFSNASDSILYVLAEFMFPQHWFKWLSRFRSYIVDIPGRGPYVPYKLSSMGNGFTFETLSLILLSIGRAIDPECSTYGDDVVISNDHANLFIKCCEAVGFQPNMKKTFINSPFRESCGAFFHDNIGYITSYDFHYVENYADLIVTCNKAFEIASMGYECSSDFASLYEKLLVYVPTSLKGPCPPDDSAFVANFNYYVYHRNWHRVHKENASRAERYQRIVDDYRSVLDTFQCNFDSTGNRLVQPNFAVITIPVFRQERVADDARVSKLAYTLASISAGRVFIDQVRSKGNWVFVEAIVDQYGTIHRTAELRRLRRIARSSGDYMISKYHFKHETVYTAHADWAKARKSVVGIWHPITGVLGLETN